MGKKESDLFKALMKFHGKDKKKVRKTLFNLVKSNDLDIDQAAEILDMFDEEVEKETRAKPVSRPAVFDYCGSEPAGCGGGGPSIQSDPCGSSGLSGYRSTC